MNININIQGEETRRLIFFTWMGAHWVVTAMCILGGGKIVKYVLTYEIKTWLKLTLLFLGTAIPIFLITLGLWIISLRPVWDRGTKDITQEKRIIKQVEITRRNK